MSTDTFFISDFHFSHKNIIEYANRPFKSIQEMDKTMIDNFIHTVPEGSTCYILGDIFEPKYLGLFINRKLIFILGNYDRSKKKEKEIYEVINDFYLDCEVYKFPILIKKFLWLSHEPLEYMTSSMPYLNIHGHSHSDINYLNGKTWEEGNRRFNVCVDANLIDYKPITLKQIGRILKLRSLT